MATVTALSRTVPAAVPGIVFLSGAVTNQRVFTLSWMNFFVVFVLFYVFSEDCLVEAVGFFSCPAECHAGSANNYSIVIPAKRSNTALVITRTSDYLGFHKQ
jgi:hypothetical protein